MTAASARLDESLYASIDDRLAASDQLLVARYPGETGLRQPIHTVYVPGDRFTAELAHAWGAQAVALMDDHCADAEQLAQIVGISIELAEAVLPLVRAKLADEPIEDLRIDFEDGYGSHTDPDEDRVAAAAGSELRHAIAAGSAPPYVGIRFKSLEPLTRRRGIRTVDIFLTALLAEGDLPDGFVLTLPKVTQVEQVEAFVEICTALESAHGLPAGRLSFEIQVETPQAVLGADGTASIAAMVHAGAPRVSGLHYGTYDYSAACGVAAAYQSLAHPVADHAKAVMQLAAAGTGVRISDGSTNVVPVGSHDEIVAAWSLHASLVQRSLERAYYQGWDLHAGHLVTRYAATYAFFRSGLPTAAARMKAYLSKTASGVMDEPATAQAMASLLVRGLHSGALTEAEVTEQTGVDRAVLDTFYRRRVG